MRTIFYFLFTFTFISSVVAKDFVVTDFGATGDGITLNTVFIQKAIDRCAADGGGRVIIPHGIFLSGTIFLKSNVDFHLDNNATLLASPNTADFPDIFKKNTEKKGLVQAEGIENATITGFGTINGNGNNPTYLIGGVDPGRTYALFLKDCKNIKVQDIVLLNPSFWTFRIYNCDEVFVRGVRVYSHANLNNDGIDVDGRNIVISDCMIEATDDGLCLKSEDNEHLCENITVTNCVITSNCNAIKFGTASNSGFRNITISNCVIKTPAENDFFNYAKYVAQGITANKANSSGISLEMVDGGTFEKVSINNITMNDVFTPIFIRFSSRHKAPQYMKDIIISNIIANSESLMTSSITGIPGCLVENIKISNIIFNCAGGGLSDHVHRQVPESEKAYPENRMLGSSLPAYGFYIRHAKNITLDNIRFNVGYTDQRPALWLEDAHNVRLDRIESNIHTAKEAYVRLREVSNITVSGFRATYDLPLFLRVEGKNSSRVKLLFNDFSTVKKLIEQSIEVDAKAIISKFNLVSSDK
ncbi:MAG: glycosyl hydrolase family 28 protein [Paludibacter sp.]